MHRVAIALTLLVALPRSGDLGVDLEAVASGLNAPVALTHAPGDPVRLFVTEQPGRVRIIRDGVLDPEAFLDITVMEGSTCFNPASNCPTTNLTLPILEYTHDEGCSISGGYVYRGSARRLQGIYFYGDFCSGTIRGAVRRIDGAWENVVEIRTTLSISAFGEDQSGELYVVDRGGRIFRISNTMPARRRPVRH